MSLVTGLRSWRLHGAQGERPEELAALVQVRGGSHCGLGGVLSLDNNVPTSRAWCNRVCTSSSHIIWPIWHACQGLALSSSCSIHGVLWQSVAMVVNLPAPSGLGDCHWQVMSTTP